MPAGIVNYCDLQAVIKTSNKIEIQNKWNKVFKNGPSKTCGRQTLKNLWDMVCLNRPYPFKILKGCHPQILLGPFLNTLSQMSVLSNTNSHVLTRNLI